MYVVIFVDHLYLIVISEKGDYFRGFCDSDRLHLVVVPDIGDDVVDVSLFRLLQNPLHQLLRNPLPDHDQDEVDDEVDFEDDDADQDEDDDDDDQDEDDYG